METIKNLVQCYGIKLSVREGECEVGRVFLYIIRNELHSQPLGYIEDLFVREERRGEGIGTKLLERVIEEARRHGCYKLIATSRFGRDLVHRLYESHGFTRNGLEFRLDLKSISE